MPWFAIVMSPWFVQIVSWPLMVMDAVASSRSAMVAFRFVIVEPAVAVIVEVPAAAMLRSARLVHDEFVPVMLMVEFVLVFFEVVAWLLCRDAPFVMLSVEEPFRLRMRSPWLFHLEKFPSMFIVALPDSRCPA